ncbi:hypothetical protein [Acetohalobium arabaticum]|uniref:Uncharacterized protein n=1 Tax=Acetohalobium arabaticum (strain ATCC 49924 / DSM 5501 / Z-7288) TaxID=574087 RepID=D9QTT7_ACEAZ|nr:hypothetical protein [Acetohalobium arabaticum]ADL13658.1 conserved hypothetical protein [Acetohalobium arabaticum DSM 5501]
MKKALSIGLIILLVVPVVSLNLQAEDLQPSFSLSKLQQVEKKLYGRNKEGEESLLQRIKDLEKQLYGRKMSGSLIERGERIFNLVLSNQPHRPSLCFTIGALEWTLQQRVEQGPIKERLINLEKLLLGEKQSGSISSRMGNLINYSLPEGKIKVKEIEIPAQSLVKIEFLEKVSSDNISESREIKYRVVEDLLVDGRLVLPAGSVGTATVESVEKAKNFGQDGKIKLSFNEINLLDNTELRLILDEKAAEKNKSMKLALGASILGTAVLGPVGLVTGYFVKGEEEVIKPGQPFFVETKVPTVAFGLPIRPGMKENMDDKLKEKNKSGRE